MRKNINRLAFCFIVICIAACAASSKMPTAYKAYKLIGTVGKIELWGGDGLSMPTAIYIKNAKSSMDGIPVEYAYLRQKYGVRDEEYLFNGQALMSEGKRSYDVLKITTLPDSTKVNVYFDISDFFGKF
ncbi:MAG: hypothetical protein V4613_04795 [Bacteroidota bacterium]